MPFEPGRAKTGGRKKGVTNKTTGQLKELILLALSNKGGVKYLERQADENPTAFLGLVGKVLPMTVQGDPENPLNVRNRIEIIIVDPSARS